MMRPTPRLAATLAILALAGCDSGRPASSGGSHASHDSAAAAMDASFDKEMGESTAKPASSTSSKPKPAADTPRSKPADSKPVIEQGRPAWIDQLPQEEGKLYAVGGAAKGRHDDARAKALRELASSLKVHVNATSTIDEAEITKIGPGGERVGHAYASYRNQARLTVDRELTFATIAAEAESGKETWALAVLDRVAWAAKLRQEIGQTDDKLSAEAVRFAASNGGLRAAAQALRAVGPLAGRRDALVNDLIMAEPQVKPPACPVDVQALFASCAKGLATVSIKLEGAPDAVFAARTQDALARQGLVVNERSATVVLRLALRETPRKLPTGWIKVTVAGSASVVDPTTGNVAGSLQIDVGEADIDEAQARAKMLISASAEIAKVINEQLIDLLGQ